MTSPAASSPQTPGAAVQVVAHRGSSEDVPEHTLAAYVKAIDDGADALECDVRLTADGHLVCVHDRRINRTSNGRGLVSTLELSHLAALDFGSWKEGGEHASDVEAPDWDRTSVLTLDRLLQLVVDAGRRVELAIETKHPTRYAGLVERRLVELLDRFGLAHPVEGVRSPVRVMSFSQMSLRRMRTLAPRLPTVFLMERVPLRFRDGTLPKGVRIAGPSIEIVRAHPRFVARLHRAGHRVHVWTVDRPDDVDLCLQLGVDAIITNRPGTVLSQVSRQPTR
ncbi:glycerophosphodiester phosphodiesterase [Yinghuangia seranimata]|uniref:glycerophosphodiester phosphodiesterase n=1 Tax=Yinghuangia seranimata TaxID=408067 RepID=UPI00248ABC93|nr:glycerophosphodiester phosphodiesterase [Yinghuangia seranimata]MDI2131890.1 glycerophosphodiester phosphodiesterase [Yinghuangia seranimata]